MASALSDEAIDHACKAVWRILGADKYHRQVTSASLAESRIRCACDCCLSKHHCNDQRMSKCSTFQAFINDRRKL